MSRWGTLEADFKGRWVSEDYIRHEFEERTAPTGSEDGPSVGHYEDGSIYVSGRLRDVTDVEHSPAVLAWFTRHAQNADEANLLWEIDNGPRYRYEWRDGELRKLRGVLDL